MALMEMDNRPHTREDNQDLTQSQLLLWMGQKLSPHSPMYNMALAFDWAISIDVPRFRAAFQSLIQQCDAMRTVFVEVEDGPKQHILSAFSYESELLDFSKLSDSENKLKEWLDTRSAHTFDISECLFDSALIKMADNRYIWYFNQHHLITDAWAVTIQYQTLLVLYQNLTAVSLPPFEAYINYEREQREQNTKQAAGNYWQQKAKRLPDPPEFFGKTNRQMESGSERISLHLSAEKSTALRAMTMEKDLRAWTQDLSLFTIFSTLLLTYLHRLSGQQKLAIGTPAHNRSTAAFKETPGLFIELFPLMAEISTEETFSSLLEKVRFDSYEFLRYAQTGSSSPELSRSFNVVLNYINASFADVDNFPMTSEWVHSGHADPGHHLRLQVHDFDGSGCIELCFDLNVAIFDATQRKAAPGHFEQLLDSFMADRFQPIGQTSLAVHTSTFVNKERTSFPFQEQLSIPDLWEANVKQLPATTLALRDANTSLTYRELDTHVNQLAHYLLKNGLAEGDRVAILLNRSPEFVISALAILKTGAAFIPIPVNYPSGRILGIIEDAQAKIVLSHSALSAALPIALDHLICLDKEAVFIKQEKNTSPQVKIGRDDLAYVMYTSGSTGQPKGVMISHQSLSHYIQWAAHQYASDFRPIMPLFTSVGFDLTITSLFLPLVAGGEIITFAEPNSGPDLSLLEVIENKKINLIKLTPSHLALLKGREYRHTSIKVMIVGGEQFKTDMAQFVHDKINANIRMYNEYGPTEATVGCVVHKYDAAKDSDKVAVPIGWPIPNTQVYILDEFAHPVPDGIAGELYISGIGLAQSYWQQEALTQEKFIPNPFIENAQMYRSGDLVRRHPKGYLEYLGRKDLQVKIRGRRVELAEIETKLNKHQAIVQAVVELRQRKKPAIPEDIDHCVQCGLPSNYPDASFNEEGVCHLCQSFTSYQEKVKKYFKTIPDLKALFAEAAKEKKGDYDCLLLLSGGKDSSYALAQLKELGLNVLAFTLDNGYISEEAKDNITRVVRELGVDHIFGETEAMDAIFVDSLQRHCNVCDGCFKTIYTLSIQIALEKKIPFIVTGLSRGQFFETRLTEELFRQEEVDIDEIDEIILTARKAYHQVDDVVKQKMDVSMFEDPQLFEKVRFLDFYRYSDVSLEEMLNYLQTRLPWVRPSDTGRSTNCLINKAGIYVHKKERGYSNYAFPYSWDVRVGHKTRQESLDEINEAINEQEVLKILADIGYTEAQESAPENEQLVAYYTAVSEVEETALRNYLLASFPDYMVPVQFIRLESLPLTVNGKIDRALLPQPDAIRPILKVEYVDARTEFEEMIQEIWTTVMPVNKIGVFDNFIDIGGDSLSGIRLMTRINEAFELDLPVNLIFQEPTIARLAVYIEDTIRTLLQEMDSQESERV